MAVVFKSLCFMSVSVVYVQDGDITLPNMKVSRAIMSHNEARLAARAGGLAQFNL